jgi:hypothetical protein
VPFVVLQLVGITLLWFAPGMATELPKRLFAPDLQVSTEAGPSRAPKASSGSPVADDFSDLLDEPVPGRNPPYRDEFEDLVQKD